MHKSINMLVDSLENADIDKHDLCFFFFQMVSWTIESSSWQYFENPETEFVLNDSEKGIEQQLQLVTLRKTLTISSRFMGIIGSVSSERWLQLCVFIGMIRLWVHWHCCALPSSRVRVLVAWDWKGQENTKIILMSKSIQLYLILYCIFGSKYISNCKRPRVPWPRYISIK